MPPSSRKDRGRTKPSDAKGRVRRGRPKVCVFCAERIAWVDYKDTNMLRRFMSDRGKIKSRANTGTCSQHQSDVAIAIKNARELALLPYAVRTLAGDKSAGRRGRGAGRPGERPDRPPTAGPAAAAAPASIDGESIPSGDGAVSEGERASSTSSEPLSERLTVPAGLAATDADAASGDEVQG